MPRFARVNPVSTAGRARTPATLVDDKPEEEGPAAAGHGHGHGH